ncbi:MAG: protease HtpX [Endozoicomonadaceae bacterium]|nr:protease HtpX [Endozoicomonadaceae bacterium]
MQRIFLFLLTNFAMIIMLSTVLHSIYDLFGLQANSITGLLVLAIIFGFGGSFISLWISKWMALKSTNAQIIHKPKNTQESWLIDTIQGFAKVANIGMPEVAIYDSQDVNAFATGANRNNALIAVSSSLLTHMTKDEAEAVLAHEISHIANGDMITLTLIQGVLNTFVIFFARLIAMAINTMIRNNADDNQHETQEEGLGFFSYMAVVFILEMLFGFLASFVVMWFSRQREYRADAGAANLAGKQKMINALRRLNNISEPALNDALNTFGIHGKKNKLLECLMSHPPIEKRIHALEQDQYMIHSR